ncbi:hypothetical protein Pint_33209 [Pistacia integerrima]|uniref:Uncharacterized protein n=1 Tax=Pistacia integerrima TaxID=434235 RepID=A0ACC0X3E9_9ROSI|nr:hypothetical protein Pint_33209 [Pistacia integerrima]
MIQPQTHLNVADNSGARELMCIRILGASNRRYAHIGDVIVAVIKEAVPNTPLQKSEVIRAVIVRTCKELKRDNGMIIRYDDNAAVVIDQEGNPKGTRVFGAIARELRQLNFTKIVSLAPEEGLDTVLYVYYLEIEPKESKLKTGRIGSRKSARRIPKGVIHVQASFNNTIVTITDVRGRVISWSSAGTCGFRGTRRGTPFAAQTAAGNAIRAVADQGMQRAEVMIKGPGLGRDAALRAIRRSGQADTIGIAMRRALLGETEGTCITRAKSEKIPHEYSTIVGIQESVHEILMNLKEIVLRSNIYGTRDALICVKGPGYVTAQDILLPPSVEIVDNTQHIASLTEPIDLCIGLQIERNRGYNNIKKAK